MYHNVQPAQRRSRVVSLRGLRGMGDDFNDSFTLDPTATDTSSVDSGSSFDTSPSLTLDPNQGNSSTPAPTPTPAASTTANDFDWSTLTTGASSLVNAYSSYNTASNQPNATTTQAVTAGVNTLTAKPAATTTPATAAAKVAATAAAAKAGSSSSMMLVAAGLLAVLMLSRK